MTSDFSVNMNEYLPLRDVVFNTLRQAILKGELKPGERLMEIALAEKLGVSRTPIREAMRKLELTERVFSQESVNNWDSHLRMSLNIFRVHLSYTGRTKTMMNSFMQTMSSFI